MRRSEPFLKHHLGTRTGRCHNHRGAALSTVQPTVMQHQKVLIATWTMQCASLGGHADLPFCWFVDEEGAAPTGALNRKSEQLLGPNRRSPALAVILRDCSNV